ncbi:hypothetical protein KEM54_003173 [Ascosphaera aggregata]|nr:hypothetical protein KEM54_003173 [Ascosphaera aggregata]
MDSETSKEPSSFIRHTTTVNSTTPRGTENPDSKSQIPDGLWELVHRAHVNGYAVYNDYRALESEWQQRFYRLCPRDDITRYHAHSCSIDRVFQWRAHNDTEDLGMTLHPAQKIPRNLVYFNVSREAYEPYYAKYTDLLRRFLEETLFKWLETRQELNETLSRISSNVPEEVRQCARWWVAFREHMRRWEGVITDFILPDFDEIIDELAAAVRDAVELQELIDGGAIGAVVSVALRSVWMVSADQGMGASLKTAPPPGVYMSISPTDPSVWSGVLFVQKGPYQSAILRFQLRFPPLYPDVPPVLTFTTDIFHPLIVPLTTCTHTTTSGDAGTFSASDDERLQAGCFSLRHGFPHWFERSQKTAQLNTRGSLPSSDVQDTSNAIQTTNEGTTEPPHKSLISQTTQNGNRDESGEFIYVESGGPHGELPDVPVLSILNYVRATFDDEDVLNSIPLEAAGNHGAWHAWQSHRRARKPFSGCESPVLDSRPSQSRLPKEWNWEGVWEQRVKTCVEASYLESTLFGNMARNAPDDLIRFSKFDLDVLDGVKEQILSKQLPIAHAGEHST